MLLTGLILAGGAFYLGAKPYRKRRQRERCAAFLQPSMNLNAYSTIVPPWYDTVQGTIAKRASETVTSLLGGTRRQQLQVVSSAADENRRRATQKAINRKLTISLTSFGLAVAGSALAVPALSLLSLPGVLYISRDMLVGSYRSLVYKHKANIDTLSSLLKILLIIQGYFIFCSFTVILYALNRKLLSNVKDNSQKNLVDVFRQQPRFVWCRSGSVEVEVPLAALQKGDIVVVSAGETIPVDGLITEGMATVDQHILTGESQPVEKGDGDYVFASTVLLSGRLYIQIEKAGEATTAAQIGQMLNQTIDIKTDMQLRAETLGDRTVLPTLLLSAVAFPIVGPMSAMVILHAHFKYRMTIIAAIGILNFLNLASKKGILIKDGRTLELLSQVDTVVFDKTGTLTEEQPHVGRIQTYNGYEEQEILRYAAAAECRQSHPIAKAILQEARLRDLIVPDIDEAQYQIGYGLTVAIDNCIVWVGSARFMEIEGMTISPAIRQTQAHCHSHGHSLVLVAIDYEIVGAIELHVTARPEAKAMIEGLRQYHITSTYMISGDHEIPTKALSKDLGIDYYYAETLPEHKAALIEQLQQEGKSVCYVGDGINDAIAMKKATVSISLRGASTVAVDTAQVIMMNQSLSQLCHLFDLAQELDRNMKRTFALVLIPSLVGMAGALFLNFGFVCSTLLLQGGLFGGVANSMLPWLRQGTAPSLPTPTVQPEGLLPHTTTAAHETTQPPVWNGHRHDLAIAQH